MTDVPRIRLITFSAAVALLLAACTGGANDLTIDDVWARSTPPGAETAAFYMHITGGDDDNTLLGATSPVCGMAEIHETTETDGTMSMAPVQGGIPIPAGETVMLEPGGFHVMCMGLVEPLVAGDEVLVELQFESGERSTVEASVTDDEMSGDMDHDH